MKHLLRRTKTLFVALAIGAAMFLSIGQAIAIDKLHTRDGKVLEGTVVREMEGFVWFKYTVAGIEQTKMFTPEEFTKLERDAAAPAVSDAPVAAPGANPGAAAPKAWQPGTPRAAVITMGNGRDDKEGDMVGMYMTKHALEQMLPMLEEELGTDGTGVVVLRFSSGGGALLEIQRLSDVIQEQYKRKFRTVAWIDSAISAAAMTAHCLEEIYFTPQGNYGACTGWFGNLTAVSGRGLEEVLFMMERISARGNYHPLLMRAMQIQVPLSATRQPNGEFSFFADTTSGEIVVNRDREILTLNAQSALDIGFSRGTASTIQELQRLMGYNELQWVGESVPGVLWPVSKAEKWNIAYRRQVNRDENSFREYVAQYNLNIQAAAQQQTRQARGQFVNRARQALDKIRNMVRNNPNFILFNLNMETEEEYREWLEAEEKRLRDMMR
jgi:hypothetical protein